LSSITSHQTKNIPANKLRIKGSEFKIGRSELNDLQILNPLISGNHTSIFRRECPQTGNMIVEVKDLSSNGTFLNG
jgi:pSer/pThr/pTyr-binding forkhead associated (FHA) protein